MVGISRRRFLGQAAAVPAAPIAALGLHASDADAGRGDEAIEDALEILRDRGPEYEGGLANHGPMAAEALIRLGRPKAVVPWVEGYKKRLDVRAAGTRRIPLEGWRDALGARPRVGDWTAFFRTRLEERPWKDVVAEWVPRLAPGVIAAAFHGPIRTAHATRSLEARETPARRRELADGLAYWAANYTALPETRLPARAPRLPSELVAGLPVVPEERRERYGLIVKRLSPLMRFEPFQDVAGRADVSGDPSRFVSDLTATFSGVFLASVPPGSWITFVHAVTGPSAVRLLLPYVDARSKGELLRYAWQGAAAHYSGFAGVAPRAARTESAPKSEELVDRAVASGDEHAIKMTEACLREHALDARPVYLLAASHTIARSG